MVLRRVLILALLLACPAPVFAELRFFSPRLNLGELRGGPIYSHRFDFLNDSSEPVEILDIRTGCGCLQPQLNKRVFQPGEKGTLTINLRTLGQPNGPRTWQAHVLYRHGQTQHEALLILAATIGNEVTVEPSMLAMTVGTTLRQELTIKDIRPQPLKVAAVQASAPAIRVTTEPQDNGVTRVVLEVSRTSMTADRQEEMLNIYTDDPGYRHLQVPITLSKASQALVQAVPNRVEFRGVSGSKLVRLRAPGEQAIAIERIETDSPAVTCTWAAGPGNDATLKITLAGQPLTQTQIRVHLRQPATTLAIPVEVRGD
jgi:hypothetical protein